MPCFMITTNVPREEIPKDATKEFVDVLSRTLKQEAWKMTILIKCGTNILFSGSDHMASCELLLSKVTHEQNIKLAKALTDKIGEILHIPSERVIITFTEVAPENIAKYGTTMAVRWASQAK